MENIVEVNVGDIVHVKDQLNREFTGLVVENVTNTPGFIFIVKLLEGLEDVKYKSINESLCLNNDGWLVVGNRDTVTVLEHPEVIKNASMLTEGLDDDVALKGCTTYRVKNPLTESYITLCATNRWMGPVGVSFANTLSESISEAAAFMKGE